MQLNTKQLYITPPPLHVPAAQSFSFAKPLSYEFRVAEYTKDGKITKVRLQVQVWEHDEFGNGNVVQYWKDVDRVPLVDMD